VLILSIQRIGEDGTPEVEHDTGCFESHRRWCSGGDKAVIPPLKEM